MIKKGKDKNRPLCVPSRGRPRDTIIRILNNNNILVN